MNYGFYLTQCVCTGYSESWTLSLFSYIINSRLYGWFFCYIGAFTNLMRTVGKKSVGTVVET